MTHRASLIPAMLTAFVDSQANGMPPNPLYFPIAHGCPSGTELDTPTLLKATQVCALSTKADCCPFEKQ
jgi:hypothetical protein